MDRVAETLRAQVAAYEAYQEVRRGKLSVGYSTYVKARRAALDAANAAEAAQDEALAEILANVVQLELF